MRLAWLLRGLVVLQVTCASLWLAGCIARAASAWAPLGVLVISFAHAPLMALEFVLLRRANRGDPAPRPTAVELLRAWAAEVLGALLVFGWHQPFRSRRFGDMLTPGGDARRGLLLVHGFVCNRGLWNPWQARLRSAGVPCIALDLQPVFGSIDLYTPLIDDAVRRLSAATGVRPLIVAHSMGGLAVRAWLREHAADERVHHVLTIGTPHHGTWLGRFGYSRNAQQMRLGSAWLRALAAAEPATRAQRFTCFFSHCDNIAFPASTATLEGADNRHLRGRAHLHLLQHPAVLAEVLRRLAGP